MELQVTVPDGTVILRFQINIMVRIGGLVIFLAAAHRRIASYKIISMEMIEYVIRPFVYC